MNIDFRKNETRVPLVREHLNELKDKRVYYDQLCGNRGDDLILYGIQQQLDSAALNIVSNAGDAEHLLIKGGGALIDNYQSLIKHIAELLQAHPNTPATILPTSYHLSTTGLPELCGKLRQAKLRVYARERYSYKALAGLEFQHPFELGMDHDSAFHLTNSNFLKSIGKSGKRKHLLIVERTDSESVTAVSKTSPRRKSSRKLPSSLIKNLMPASVKSALKHKFKLPEIEKQAKATAFASSATEFVCDRYPEFKSLPVRCFDVSQNHLNTFAQFATIISQSAVVVSTRLHVGILSAMLGIPTYVVAGSYHKLRGIYRYSMQANDHVTLIDKSLNVIEA